MNVKSMKESPFFSFIEKNLDENPFYSDEYEEFIEATGLDIRKDIDEVYFSFRHGEEGDDPDMFTMVKGNYQPDRIMDYIMEESNPDITEENFRDRTIYIMRKERFAICFVDGERLIAGPRSLLKDWLTTYDENPQAALSDQRHEKIQQLKYKSQAWMVVDTRSLMDEMLDEWADRNNRFQGIKSLQHVNFSMKFDDNMKFYGIGQFDDAENAELFRDAVKGAIATAKLSMSEDRKAIDVLNKINISLNGKEMSVRFKMSKEDIERLRQKRKDLARW
jgi:hypothetical protein